MLAVIFSSNATHDVNGPAKKVSISGAGATFPLPFYNLAFKTYQDKTGNSITYGGIGSGGGIRSLKDKIVDFGFQKLDFCFLPSYQLFICNIFCF